MARAPLDELYFTWLYRQVAVEEDRDPSRSYLKLLRKLFTKEFIWIVGNDDNRGEDGRDLRSEFLEEEHISDVDPNWAHLRCSMLELLIGLARRLSFHAEGEANSWFWTLIENLELERFNDNVRLPNDRVDQILDRVIWRRYQPDGIGGLFPLYNWDGTDQTKVELWYQMHMYILERAL